MNNISTATRALDARTATFRIEVGHEPAMLTAFRVHADGLEEVHGRALAAGEHAIPVEDELVYVIHPKGAEATIFDAARLDRDGQMILLPPPEMHVRLGGPTAPPFPDLVDRIELQSWVLSSAPWLVIAGVYAAHKAALGAPLDSSRLMLRQIEPASKGADPANAGGLILRCQNGAVVLHPVLGCHAIVGPIYQKWVALGAVDGPGYPVTEERDAGDGVGRYQLFRRATSSPFFNCAIYWSPTTKAQLVAYQFLQRLTAFGGATGKLGYPLTDTKREPPPAIAPQGQIFEHAELYGNSYPYAILEPVLSAWRKLGGHRALTSSTTAGPGYPTADTTVEGDRTLGTFANPLSASPGTLLVRGSETAWIFGIIDAKWRAAGAGASAWGWPMGVQAWLNGRFQAEFEHCTAYWNGLVADGVPGAALWFEIVWKSQGTPAPLVPARLPLIKVTNGSDPIYWQGTYPANGFIAGGKVSDIKLVSQIGPLGTPIVILGPKAFAAYVGSGDYSSTTDWARITVGSGGSLGTQFKKVYGQTPLAAITVKAVPALATGSIVDNLSTIDVELTLVP